MDFLLKFLILGGKYLTRITSQSILEAYRRSVIFGNKLNAKYEKTLCMTGNHETILDLYNTNFSEMDNNSIPLCFSEHKEIMDTHRYNCIGNKEAKQESDKKIVEVSETNVDKSAEMNAVNERKPFQDYFENPIKPMDNDFSANDFVEPNFASLQRKNIISFRSLSSPASSAKSSLKLKDDKPKVLNRVSQSDIIKAKHVSRGNSKIVISNKSSLRVIKQAVNKNPPEEDIKLTSKILMKNEEHFKKIEKSIYLEELKNHFEKINIDAKNISECSEKNWEAFKAAEKNMAQQIRFVAKKKKTEKKLYKKDLERQHIIQNKKQHHEPRKYNEKIECPVTPDPEPFIISQNSIDLLEKELEKRGFWDEVDAVDKASQKILDEPMKNSEKKESSTLRAIEKSTDFNKMTGTKNFYIEKPAKKTKSAPIIKNIQSLPESENSKQTTLAVSDELEKNYMTLDSILQGILKEELLSALVNQCHAAKSTNDLSSNAKFLYYNYKPPKSESSINLTSLMKLVEDEAALMNVNNVAYSKMERQLTPMLLQHLPPPYSRREIIYPLQFTEANLNEEVKNRSKVMDVNKRAFEELEANMKVVKIIKKKKYPNYPIKPGKNLHTLANRWFNAKLSQSRKLSNLVKAIRSYCTKNMNGSKSIIIDETWNKLDITALTENDLLETNKDWEDILYVQSQLAANILGNEEECFNYLTEKKSGSCQSTTMEEENDNIEALGSQISSDDEIDEELLNLIRRWESVETSKFEDPFQHTEKINLLKYKISNLFQKNSGDLDDELPLKPNFPLSKAVWYTKRNLRPKLEDNIIFIKPYKQSSEPSIQIKKENSEQPSADVTIPKNTSDYKNKLLLNNENSVDSMKKELNGPDIWKDEKNIDIPCENESFIRRSLLKNAEYKKNESIQNLQITLKDADDMIKLRDKVINDVVETLKKHSDKMINTNVPSPKLLGEINSADSLRNSVLLEEIPKETKISKTIDTNIIEKQTFKGNNIPSRIKKPSITSSKPFLNLNKKEVPKAEENLEKNVSVNLKPLDTKEKVKIATNDEKVHTFNHKLILNQSKSIQNIPTKLEKMIGLKYSSDDLTPMKSEHKKVYVDPFQRKSFIKIKNSPSTKPDPVMINKSELVIMKPDIKEIKKKKIIGYNERYLLQQILECNKKVVEAENEIVKKLELVYEQLLKLKTSQAETTAIQKLYFDSAISKKSSQNNEDKSQKNEQEKTTVSQKMLTDLTDKLAINKKLCNDISTLNAFLANNSSNEGWQQMRQMCLETPISPKESTTVNNENFCPRLEERIYLPSGIMDEEIVTIKDEFEAPCDFSWLNDIATKEIDKRVEEKKMTIQNKKNSIQDSNKFKRSEPPSIRKPARKDSISKIGISVIRIGNKKEDMFFQEAEKDLGERFIKATHEISKMGKEVIPEGNKKDFKTNENVIDNVWIPAPKAKNEIFNKENLSSKIIERKNQITGVKMEGKEKNVSKEKEENKIKVDETKKEEVSIKENCSPKAKEEKVKSAEGKDEELCLKEKLPHKIKEEKNIKLVDIKIEETSIKENFAPKLKEEKVNIANAKIGEVFAKEKFTPKLKEEKKVNIADAKIGEVSAKEKFAAKLKEEKKLNTAKRGEISAKEKFTPKLKEEKKVNNTDAKIGEVSAKENFPLKLKEEKKVNNTDAKIGEVSAKENFPLKLKEEKKVNIAKSGEVSAKENFALKLKEEKKVNIADVKIGEVSAKEDFAPKLKEEKNINITDAKIGEVSAKEKIASKLKDEKKVNIADAKVSVKENLTHKFNEEKKVVIVKILKNKEDLSTFSKIELKTPLKEKQEKCGTNEKKKTHQVNEGSLQSKIKIQSLPITIGKETLEKMKAKSSVDLSIEKKDAKDVPLKSSQSSEGASVTNIEKQLMQKPETKVAIAKPEEENLPKVLPNKTCSELMIPCETLISSLCQKTFLTDVLDDHINVMLNTVDKEIFHETKHYLDMSSKVLQNTKYGQKELNFEEFLDEEVSIPVKSSSVTPAEIKPELHQTTSKEVDIKRTNKNLSDNSRKIEKLKTAKPYELGTLKIAPKPPPHIKRVEPMNNDNQPPSLLIKEHVNKKRYQMNCASTREKKKFEFKKPSEVVRPKWMKYTTHGPSKSKGNIFATTGSIERQEKDFENQKHGNKILTSDSRRRIYSSTYGSSDTIKKDLNNFDPGFQTDKTKTLIKGSLRGEYKIKLNECDDYLPPTELPLYQPKTFNPLLSINNSSPEELLSRLEEKFRKNESKLAQNYEYPCSIPVTISNPRPISTVDKVSSTEKLIDFSEVKKKLQNYLQVLSEMKRTKQETQTKTYYDIESIKKMPETYEIKDIPNDTIPRETTNNKPEKLLTCSITKIADETKSIETEDVSKPKIKYNITGSKENSVNESLMANKLLGDEYNVLPVESDGSKNICSAPEGSSQKLKLRSLQNSPIRGDVARLDGTTQTQTDVKKEKNDCSIRHVVTPKSNTFIAHKIEKTDSKILKRIETKMGKFNNEIDNIKISSTSKGRPKLDQLSDIDLANIKLLPRLELDNTIKSGEQFINVEKAPNFEECEAKSYQMPITSIPVSEEPEKNKPESELIGRNLNNNICNKNPKGVSFSGPVKLFRNSLWNWEMQNEKRNMQKKTINKIGLVKPTTFKTKNHAALQTTAKINVKMQGKLIKTKSAISLKKYKKKSSSKISKQKMSNVSSFSSCSVNKNKIAYRYETKEIKSKTGKTVTVTYLVKEPSEH